MTSPSEAESRDQAETPSVLAEYIRHREEEPRYTGAMRFPKGRKIIAALTLAQAVKNAKAAFIFFTQQKYEEDRAALRQGRLRKIAEDDYFTALKKALWYAVEKAEADKVEALLAIAEQESHAQLMVWFTERNEARQTLLLLAHAQQKQDTLNAIARAIDRVMPADCLSIRALQGEFTEHTQRPSFLNVSERRKLAIPTIFYHALQAYVDDAQRMQERSVALEKPQKELKLAHLAVSPLSVNLEYRAFGAVKMVLPPFSDKLLNVVCQTHQLSNDMTENEWIVALNHYIVQRRSEGGAYLHGYGRLFGFSADQKVRAAEHFYKLIQGIIPVEHFFGRAAYSVSVRALRQGRLGELVAPIFKKYEFAYHQSCWKRALADGDWPILYRLLIKYEGQERFELLKLHAANNETALTWITGITEEWFVSLSLDTMFASLSDEQIFELLTQQGGGVYLDGSPIKSTALMRAFERNSETLVDKLLAYANRIPGGAERLLSIKNGSVLKIPFSSLTQRASPALIHKMLNVLSPENRDNFILALDAGRVPDPGPDQGCSLLVIALQAGKSEAFLGLWQALSLEGKRRAVVEITEGFTKRTMLMKIIDAIDHYPENNVMEDIRNLFENRLSVVASDEADHNALLKTLLLAKDGHNHNALHLAIRRDLSDVTRYLLEVVPDQATRLLMLNEKMRDSKNGRQCNALELAANRGKLDILKQLFDCISEDNLEMNCDYINGALRECFAILEQERDEQEIKRYEAIVTWLQIRASRLGILEEELMTRSIEDAVSTLFVPEHHPLRPDDDDATVVEGDDRQSERAGFGFRP